MAKPLHLTQKTMLSPSSALQKLYVIAGEASGDLHGSNLLKSLFARQPDLHCRVWGGDLMQQAGGELVKHYRDLAFMGFWEVVTNLRTILRNLEFCKKDILQYQPDALVLIDYPGFNLRIARWAKQQGIRVIYYISPQIWAWHTSRVQAIRRDVDSMLVILPFEQDFYRQHGVEVAFVGHPLLDAVAQFAQQAQPLVLPEDKPVIALLPGSRRQEVRRILPVMLAASRAFTDHQLVVAGAAALSADFYAEFLREYPHVRLIQGKTYAILRQAQAALVKSGTSTLETALFDVPQVVCYAGNPLSYQIAKRVVQVKYISLVNLIADAPVVEELIQADLTPDNASHALTRILQPDVRAVMQEQYAALRQKLGSGGASDRAAEAVLLETYIK